MLERARLIDVLSALSLTTDLAASLPFERFLATFDPGDETVAGAQLAVLGAAVGPRARWAFLEAAPTVGPVAVTASCEVAIALGTQLGFPETALAAFDDVFDCWVGLGLQPGREGEAVQPIARIVHVAEQAAMAHAAGGLTAARAEIARRAGGHLDPSLCEAFLERAEEFVARSTPRTISSLPFATRSRDHVWLSQADLERPCTALATFAELKGTTSSVTRRTSRSHGRGRTPRRARRHRRPPDRGPAARRRPRRCRARYGTAHDRSAPRP